MVVAGNGSGDALVLTEQSTAAWAAGTRASARKAADAERSMKGIQERK